MDRSVAGHATGRRTRLAATVIAIAASVMSGPSGVGAAASSPRVGGSPSPHQVVVPSTHLVVASAGDARTGGYWLAASDGGVFSFGAPFEGSAGGLPLVAPVVGMSPTSDFQGYWLVASDGGVFSYGDARFFGSMGGLPLNKPIVGMAATSDGGGYWLVASDGGVFAFGDARYLGSMGGVL